MNKRYRRTIIAGNWKMNMLASGIKPFTEELIPLVPDFHKWCETVVCVPFPLLPEALRVFKSYRIRVGAQNMSQFESGAYTGEVSSAQLMDIGVGYVIIGHSERRELYGETDMTVNKKVHAALNGSLCPIICVGETLVQREAGVTNNLVATQLKSALYGVQVDKPHRAVIAYEPIWAIGTGKTATPDDAQQVCREIRAVIRSLYGAHAARVIPVLYGGSMNEKNAPDLLAQQDIDGGLIGGASLKPASFAAIINAANPF
ncbi:MAG: triose-phosphate isomerase [Oscillospiraceae bacterium]|nr:triose-phosphate isomerase [Oscillospiraceae bacterium]